MKKLLVLISVFVGFAALGLRAEEAPATVSLPAIQAPAPEPAPAANAAPAGDEAAPKKSGHKGHGKTHHTKKSGETAPAGESAPKS